MIAWKLTVDFDTQKHLFFEKIKTDYVITVYICDCGHTDFIIHNNKQIHEYICHECQNTKFYDADSAWKNGNFLYQYRDLDFRFEYAIKTNKNSITSMYVTKIPKNIDFLNNKVLFENKSVCNIQLTFKGDLKESYSLKFNEKILLTLKKNLTQYITKYKIFDIPYSQEKIMTLKMASFFLKNKNLKSFDFYYWKDIDMLQDKEVNINDALELISNYSKAKSVKKALYKNYLRQLESYDYFDSTFIEVFCHTIKDINILVKLLSLNLNYSKYSDFDKKNLKELIVFLKLHYTEKQILKLFSSDEFRSNKYLFRDAVREFHFNKGIVEEMFKKVSCKVQALHDEFVRCSREQRYKYMINKTLDYTLAERKVCIQIDEYQIKLPQTGKELYDWANTLHNCMAGYFDLIKMKESIIYGFFQKDILIFAVEIKDDSIIQASEKYNAKLSVENKKILKHWLEIFFHKTFQYTSKEFINNVCI